MDIVDGCPLYGTSVDIVILRKVGSPNILRVMSVLTCSMPQPYESIIVIENELVGVRVFGFCIPSQAILKEVPLTIPKL